MLVRSQISLQITKMIKYCRQFMKESDKRVELLSEEYKDYRLSDKFVPQFVDTGYPVKMLNSKWHRVLEMHFCALALLTIGSLYSCRSMLLCLFKLHCYVFHSNHIVYKYERQRVCCLLGDV